MILGGASSMLMPTLDWLFQQGRLDKLRYVAIVDDLNTLSELSFTRKEARDLLFKLIKKTMKNFLSRVRAGFDHVLMIIKKITA